MTGEALEPESGSPIGPSAPSSGQKRARLHGNAGIPGTAGNVVCV